MVCRCFWLQYIVGLVLKKAFDIFHHLQHVFHYFAYTLEADKQIWYKVSWLLIQAMPQIPRYDIKYKERSQQLLQAHQFEILAQRAPKDFD